MFAKDLVFGILNSIVNDIMEGIPVTNEKLTCPVLMQ